MDNEQLIEIGQGFADGLNADQIQIYAKENISSEVMSLLRRMLNEEMDIEMVNYIANNTDLSYNRLRYMIMGLKNGLSVEQVDLFAKNDIGAADVATIIRAFITIKRHYKIMSKLLELELSKSIDNKNTTADINTKKCSESQCDTANTDGLVDCDELVNAFLMSVMSE